MNSWLGAAQVVIDACGPRDYGRRRRCGTICTVGEAKSSQATQVASFYVRPKPPRPNLTAARTKSADAQQLCSCVRRLVNVCYAYN